MTIPGVAYSPARKGFVSRTGIVHGNICLTFLGLAFKAEHYADIVEFKAFANLFGPYGVKLVDREVLKFILSNVNSIKVAVFRLCFDTPRTTCRTVRMHWKS